MRTTTFNCRIFGLVAAGCGLVVGCSDDSDPITPDDDGGATVSPLDGATSGDDTQSTSTTSYGSSVAFDGGQSSDLLDGGTLPDGAVVDAAVDGAFPADASADASDADASVTEFPPEAAITNAWVPEGFSAWEWSNGLQEPRGVVVDNDGTVLVVEEDGQRISALWDEDGDGVSSAEERAVIATAPGLNHGIALNGGYLYASSAAGVYRWAYNDEHADLGTPTEVISGIPSDGNHKSRTLLFDDTHLYVSVGSAANVDPDSSRAQIRRFAIADLGTSRAFGSGELFADGLRNEVGLALDGFGQIWGVENGMDDLTDSDLGGDIHNTNPGEELNLFATPGEFYGYPYCWSEYDLDSDAGAGPGAQWWLEGSELGGPDAGVDDAWCKDPANVVPPVLVFPAHVAPLDIRFYAGANFPTDYVGDALVTFHGSWNTEPPAGYKVVRVRMDDAGQPTGEWEPLYQFLGASDTGEGWNERPVGLAILPDGTLLVTSDDDADRIIAIKYTGVSEQPATQNDL